MAHEKLFAELGLQPENGEIKVFSPIDGTEIGRIGYDRDAVVNAKIALAAEAFQAWRLVPAPKRGELVRLLGEELRAAKEPLGRLVSLECGKILAEGLGEVQEMIDICDFAIGQSRQLYGLTIASERPGHRMMETWHPLGPIGVISAFNFPVAVWAWNFALAIVCGDPVIWKPSEKTPLCALACQNIFARAAARFNDAPEGLMQVVLGGANAGAQLVADTRLPLISATGSCRMGALVGPVVAERFGRSLLELGGNNAMIVTASADLELAVRAILFSAVGTAGQRCTSLRRLIVQDGIAEELTARLKSAYAAIPVGDPLADGTLVGPLIDGAAYEAMKNALATARTEGGTVTGGERLLSNDYPDAYYVRPAIAEMPAQTNVVRAETFAPILYVMRYSDLDAAIHMHNDVAQGLASSIFTNDMREAEAFLAAPGSDCGIANVNIGPSGAEIGGAFGGEKETGGGRESGSDAWKAYMRRATNTINYSTELPLAQGIRFEV
ncbi:MAG: aldehyde dehydrogenase family protein [Rhodospirillaceae bacterium]|jgi:aldehyde dehydrogenase (NAD+)|nr:aldehyde dehydrogenase family protein [Rhodospirillaceae bacterium]MBT3884626.1 aldehyde dehydrogenase family protein [Rhodospirillaceae bacterium]MBT4117488.1 aldehyde dehydrogenase family protein [Rhodospirillaceae bacterium]MBT4672070.1 aldehyde dehydrogenase family protein [Rhodospirillaceae bacterium]MBT4718334.1 aldehyde dehydrogenase family protein [Rhodospirillaceae bacterium]